MALFPQIATGAVTQMPVRNGSRYITRRNVMADETVYRFRDLAAPLARFGVNLAGVADADINALISFFNSQKGAYNRFVFLDPLRNLVKWSEDFSQALWSKFAPGSFTFTGGQADPLGGTAATLVTNSSGSTNSVWQDIAAGPESQYFTGSIWLKQSTPGVSVTLRAEDGLGQFADTVATPGNSWQRFWVTRQFSASAAATTRLTFIFAAAASVYAFGAQLAYLPGPGGYSKNKGTAGVYPVCRFEDDALGHRIEAFGVNGAQLRIVEIAG